MDFTREPIIESVITPKEGCKLVVRSSKGTGQEEFFVDAVEVVAFGSSFFLRSLERPKAFLVPATDYEILEVRETRMVLKNVGMDRSIKIGGGKDSSKKASKDSSKAAQDKKKQEEKKQEEKKEESKPEPKRREKRRHYRRRKGRDKGVEEGTEEGKIDLQEPKEIIEGNALDMGNSIVTTPSVLGSLLPPPPNLISDTIERYKDNALFKDVFYSEDDFKEEEVEPKAAKEESVVEVEKPSEKPEVAKEDSMVEVEKSSEEAAVVEDVQSESSEEVEETNTVS